MLEQLGEVESKFGRYYIAANGKRHDNVMRDIRKMLEQLGEGLLKFEGIYLDAYGREKPCFHLPRFGDISPTVMDGLSRSL